jgi:hypothetical protein
MNKTLTLLLLLIFTVGCASQNATPTESVPLNDGTPLPEETAALQAETPALQLENTKPAPPQQLPVTVEPGQQPTKEENMTTPETPPSFPSGMEGLIERAKYDLAERLSIEINDIEVTQAEAVTWPNASLGCPQPGMAYAEVLTPGYLILLQANNQTFEYHTSQGTEVIYCTNPQPPVSGTPSDQ